MEYRIDISNRTVDFARIEATVRNYEPAATLALCDDGRELRIAATLSRPMLSGLLAVAGLVVETAALQAQPSVCCGGCGG